MLGFGNNKPQNQDAAVPKIIAFANQKGGWVKQPRPSIWPWLGLVRAAGFADRRRPQGNASTGLGAHDRTQNLYHVLVSNRGIQRTIQKRPLGLI